MELPIAPLATAYSAGIGSFVPQVDGEHNRRHYPISKKEISMPKVVGIGGVFFRAADPAALAEWYQKHLGIDDLHKSVWHQEAGMTIFGPFSQNTDYFGRAEQQWMINFRVDDLDGLIADLKTSGIGVETRAEWDSEVGRFARIHDPEGNPIELWEPMKN